MHRAVAPIAQPSAKVVSRLTMFHRPTNLISATMHHLLLMLLRGGNGKSPAPRNQPVRLKAPPAKHWPLHRHHMSMLQQMFSPLHQNVIFLNLFQPLPLLVFDHTINRHFFRCNCRSTHRDRRRRYPRNYF